MDKRNNLSFLEEMVIAIKSTYQILKEPRLYIASAIISIPFVLYQHNQYSHDLLRYEAGEIDNKPELDDYAPKFGMDKLFLRD